MIRRYLFYSRSDKQQNSFQHPTAPGDRKTSTRAKNDIKLCGDLMDLKSELSSSPPSIISYDHCRCPD